MDYKINLHGGAIAAAGPGYARALKPAITDANDDARTRGAAWPGTETTALDWSDEYIGASSSLFYIVGFRFPSALPRNATIGSAKLILKSTSDTSAQLNVDIFGGAGAIGPFNSTDNRPCDVARTAASVNWNVGTASWIAGTAYESPDLAAIVNEIIGGSGWAAGSPIVLLIANHAATLPSSSERREVKLYDYYHQGDAPRLEITYTLPGGNAFYEKAVYFDGTGDYGEVASRPVFSASNTGQLTVCAWIKPEVLDFPNVESSDDGPYCHFLGKGDYGSPDNQFEWGFRMYNKTGGGRPNRVSFYLWNPAGGLGVGSYVQDDVVAGEWMHLVGAADEASTYIYKNGVLRDSDIYNVGDINNSEVVIVPALGIAPVRIGTRDFHSYFQGAIGCVKVYNRKLSDAEVVQEFNNNGPTAGLVARMVAKRKGGRLFGA